jgi:putative MATE family efflux protein
MDRSRVMGEGSIPRLLLKFSVPAIVGMLVNALYNVVDRIFIGLGVGPLGIAGITVGFPIMIVQMAFGMLIGMGATALISIRLGEKKKEQAERILGNAFSLLVLVSLGLMACGLLWLRPLLALFGASPAILGQGEEYLRVILAGSVFMGVGFGMNGFIRAEGNPRTAMLTMLIGAVLNTLLDPLFIFVFRLGVRGAATATVISQAVSAAWVLGYFLGGRSLLRLRLPNLRIRRETAAAIVALGFAPFAMQLAASLLNAILTRQLQRYGGDLAIAAMGIFFSLNMLIFMPVFGINQGAQPLIGYNYGARRFDRVRSTLRLAVAAATAVMLAGFAAVELFPSFLLSLFSRDSASLLAIGVPALRIGMAALPIVGFQVVAASYFQASGRVRLSMLLMLSRQVLLLIPAILVLPRFLGLAGIYYAVPLSDLGSALLTGACLALELRKLGRKHGEPDAAAAGALGQVPAPPPLPQRQFAE